MKRKRGYLSGKRGQIWVETVIYTLIAFSVMGLVLAFVLPKIQETQDKGVIDQSISSLQTIDSTITTIGDPGNVRVLNLNIKQGDMTIDPMNDRIYFTLDSRYQYSEPGNVVSVGKVDADTEKKGDRYTVTLTLNYAGEYNVTYDSSQNIKDLSSSSIPYKVSISNDGKDSQGNTLVNIQVS